MAGLKVLIQRHGEVDVEGVVDFISSLDSPRLVLLFSSIEDEFVNLDFFQAAMGKIKLPFLGVRVIDCASKEGYSEDLLLVVVLCGDCKARVLSTEIDCSNPDITANQINSAIGAEELMITYSANVAKNNAWVNYILKTVQKKNPALQIFGGVCGNPPFIATADGVFNNRLGYVLIDGLKFDFEVDSGFKFLNDGSKHVVTKSDEYYIRELDGVTAPEKYCRIQHVQPYFLNMFSNLFVKPKCGKLMRALSKTSTTMYEGVMKMGVKLLGSEICANVVEILSCMELGKDYILSQNNRRVGTVLQRVTTSPEDQLNTYDRLKNKAKNPKAIIVSSCFMCACCFDFKFDRLKEKLGQFNCPIVVIYGWGEIGAPLPPKKSDGNLLHGGVIKSLIIK